MRAEALEAGLSQLPLIALADRYRRLSGRLTRAWALSSGTDALAPLRNEVLFYEEVRVYMAKFAAEDAEPPASLYLRRSSACWLH
jgi:restriction endonuclease HindI-like protein